MPDRTAFILLFLYGVASMPMQVGGFPAPFYRVLSMQDPPLEGKDVVILQNLLLRSPFVKPIDTTGIYDNNTAHAVASYQNGNHLPSIPGIFDEQTASLVLRQLIYDGYRDDGTVPSGYKFKVHVPVYKDRTIETTATLFDDKNEVRYRFLARCHGSLDSTGKTINQLTRNGNTPTGLVTFDLNSPEPDPEKFGPYPVIRAVKGLKGNAAIGKNKDDTFLSDYRSGILLHTGEWKNWNSSLPMPNSRGCIHVHPEDMKEIDRILAELGINIRPNTLGKLPYPYKPQGILSVEEIES
ncbi:unnamed protein product [Porites lobata]|uniref:Uncharacterized protein n=1 Tax=Porites lobata TaxID=104759 RepID=A0ABN8PFD1_9CNID|nr:unnamed protein product [Porites lobata]